MKALILNSGLGSRMSNLTENNPKCLIELANGETVLARQLRQLSSEGLTDVVITTGYMADAVEKACMPFCDTIRFEFVENPEYRTTNYIYSIYLARESLRDDIIMLHGDLVFDDRLIADIITFPHSYMAVSRDRPLPEKDFKAVIEDGRIIKVGVSYFENALYAQPLYKLKREEWTLWLSGIERYCEADNRSCYAEEALNNLPDGLNLYPFEVGMRLCMEVDTPDDLRIANLELSR